jgi:hypothetical protein
MLICKNCGVPIRQIITSSPSSIYLEGTWVHVSPVYAERQGCLYYTDDPFSHLDYVPDSRYPCAEPIEKSGELTEYQLKLDF